MTNRRSKLVEISFQFEGQLYRANVFLNQPTAIVIHDQGIVATTTLGPKPDSSTQKNRHRKVILPTEKQEAQIDTKQVRKPSRTIYDETGRLNNFVTKEIAPDQPFSIDSRFQVIATRLYKNAK